MTGFINPAQYTAAEAWKTHVVDLFDYTEEPVKDQMLGLVERDALPRWGKIDYDVDGKLIGNWFKVGSGGYAGGSQLHEGHWKGHLSIVNGVWRNESDYWQDFRDFGLAEYIDAIVSSVDTLWRKPHNRFYEAALQAAGASADACLLVGNSEAKDIEPAAELGMTTIRVAIEEDRARTTKARFQCDSLEAVVEIIAKHRSGAG